MCVVSMVSDYGIQKVFPEISPNFPNFHHVSAPNWVGPGTVADHKIVTMTEYNELLRKAKEFDEKTGQPECPDPVKMAKMEEYCKKFETMGTEMFRLANELRNILK
jgi:hypothetical protein